MQAAQKRTKLARVPCSDDIWMAQGFFTLAEMAFLVVTSTGASFARATLAQEKQALLDQCTRLCRAIASLNRGKISPLPTLLCDVGRRTVNPCTLQPRAGVIALLRQHNTLAPLVRLLTSYESCDDLVGGSKLNELDTIYLMRCWLWYRAKREFQGFFMPDMPHAPETHCRDHSVGMMRFELLMNSVDPEWEEWTNRVVPRMRQVVRTHLVSQLPRFASLFAAGSWDSDFTLCREHWFHLEDPDRAVSNYTKALALCAEHRDKFFWHNAVLPDPDAAYKLTTKMIERQRDVAAETAAASQ